MNRINKHYMLSNSSIEYIEEVKEKNNLKYNSEALDLIIREHRTNSDITTEVMIKLIGEKIAEQLKTELLGIKRASNSSDKNTQILIEVMNGFLIKSQMNIPLSTSNNTKCVAIENATKYVEERISKQRTTKLDKTY